MTRPAPSAAEPAAAAPEPAAGGPEPSGLRLPPEPARLEALFRDKFGALEACGWSPRMRWGFRYFTPDEHYEAVVESLVGPSTRWVDVGCGRMLLPNNERLAKRLAGTAARLVGVDPDRTIQENPFVHEKVQQGFDEFDTDERFDLVTLRMVAEHVADPEQVADVLARVTAPGGRVVIYTVHKWAPVPLITSLVPFGARHAVKRFLWRTEEKDTFPTCFRMNTRGTLRRLFGARGLEEEGFVLLDDCRSLARFRIGQWCELALRRVLRGVGLAYPEVCLLGVYRRPAAD